MAQAFEDPDRRLAQVQHTRLHRIGTAPIGKPTDLQLPTRSLGPIGTAGMGVPWVVFGEDGQEQLKVANGARHRAFGRELRQEEIARPAARHKPIAGAKAKDVVPSRRIAQ